MGHFSEDSYDALPIAWRNRCLNFSALRGKILANARGQSVVPTHQGNIEEGRRQLETPVLPLSLKSDPKHTGFAEVIRRELDSAFAFLDDQLEECQTKLVFLENLAQQYSHTMPAASFKAKDTLVSSIQHPDDGDPFLRTQLKDGLAQLFQEQSRQVIFRMLTNEVCERLVALQIRITCEEVIQLGTVGKELTSYIMGHAIFTELGPKSSKLAKETNVLYAALFCNGDTEVAQAALAFHSAEKNGGRSLRRFEFGIRLGAAMVMWDLIVDPDMGKDVWHDPAFKVYRGLGNLVLLVWCWGVNLWVWRHVGIDYERFLELDPTQIGEDPCIPVWNEAIDLSIAFLLSLICFWKSLRGVFFQGMPETLAHTFPLTLFLYIMYRVFMPWKQRKLIFTSIKDVMVAPFGTTRFKEGFVGDILTSVVRVLIDVVFSVGYFACGLMGWYANSLHLDQDEVQDWWIFQWVLVPLITVLPLWWRFLQNLQRSYDTRQRWPHLGNAMKYATAQTVGLYGLFHANARSNGLWIFGFVFATLYQYTWDIFMDWDLLRFKNGRPAFRENLLYQNKSFYLAIMVVNLVLRFFWSLTLIPEGGQLAWQRDLQVRLSPILAGGEICRRCVWGFLRLENEHLHVYGTSPIEKSMSMGSLSDLKPMAVKHHHHKDDALFVFVGPFRISSSTAKYSVTYVTLELTAIAAFVFALGISAAFILP